MLRTWNFDGEQSSGGYSAPTSEAVVRDIMRIPKALDDCIAAGGAKVVSERRRGRRAAKRCLPAPIAAVEELERVKRAKQDPEGAAAVAKFEAAKAAKAREPTWADVLAKAADSGAPRGKRTRR